MAHKTITISDDAYEALAKPRRERVFHEGDPRLTSGSDGASSLLEHLRDSPADEELAGSIERAMRKTRSARGLYAGHHGFIRRRNRFSVVQDGLPCVQHPGREPSDDGPPDRTI